MNGTARPMRETPATVIANPEFLREFQYEYELFENSFNTAFTLEGVHEDEFEHLQIQWHRLNFLVKILLRQNPNPYAVAAHLGA